VVTSEQYLGLLGNKNIGTEDLACKAGKVAERQAILRLVDDLLVGSGNNPLNRGVLSRKLWALMTTNLPRRHSEQR
jgi:hypothetical protein